MRTLMTSLLAFTSCSPQSIKASEKKSINSSDKIHPTAQSKKDNKPQPSIELKGELLYKNHCSLCHNPIQKSTKAGKTKEQITWALGNIPQMKKRENLQKLTPEQISKIAQSLDQKTLRGQSENNKAQPILGTRDFFANKMRSLYRIDKDTEHNKKINKSIYRNILKNNTVFGGLCTFHDAKPCPKNDSISTLGSSSPTHTPLRSGYRLKTCQEILSQRKSVESVLDKAGIHPKEQANTLSLQQLYQVYSLYRPANENSLNALTQLFIKSSESGKKTFQGWRFVNLALCQSLTTEVM